MFFKKKKYEEGVIANFSILTIRESTMRGIYEYEVKNVPGWVEVSYYSIRFNISEGKEYRQTEAHCECDKKMIIKMLNDCELLSFDGFYGKHPRGVFDGTMFRLDAVVNGGRKLHAEGSANFPPRYHDLVSEIARILNENKKLIDSVSPEEAPDAASLLAMDAPLSDAAPGKEDKEEKPEDGEEPQEKDQPATDPSSLLGG